MTHPDSFGARSTLTVGDATHEIFRLFEDPFYAGAHAALRALGVPAVLTVIRESVDRWPAVRIVDKEA